MYTLMRSIPLSRFVHEQLPALVAALLVAETFYKFHSFTLKCLAFLATWFVMDAAISTIAARIRSRPIRVSGSR
mgnify:CR=1 FL=1